MKKFSVVLTTSLAFSFILASMNNVEPADKVQLGRLLFFDSILSGDMSVVVTVVTNPNMLLPIPPQ